jgi:hypothetical protein
MKRIVSSARSPLGLRLTAVASAPFSGILVACLVGLGGCAPQTAPTGASGAPLPSPAKVATADFQIVDCRLPPRLRQIGTLRLYLEPGRLTRTTLRDCGIRGGDAVLYDPANYAIALRIWEPLAKEGDPKAQTYLGEIYQKGLAGNPDYAAAAEWYRRAADQGYASAQVSLGQLYERGLGVAKDTNAALDLYRQASGLREPLAFIPRSELERLQQQGAEDQRKVEALRRDLERLQRERDEAYARLQELRRTADRTSAEADALRQQIARLQKELADARVALDERQQAADTGAETALRQQVDRLQRQLADAQSELDNHQIANRRTQLEILALNQLVGDKAVAIATGQKRLKSLASIDFGRYHALVIGIDSYQPSKGLQPLQSAVPDAALVADILEKQYGYTVVRRFDATRDQIIDSLNTLRHDLTPADNLLIYYAGHGFVDAKTSRGYWLPVDAQAYPDTTKWISNAEITDVLQSMRAKRVLVVADSCYAGSLGKAGGGLLEIPKDERISTLKAMAKLPARLVLTSGDLSPVADRGEDGRHSIFANALVLELGTNSDIMEGWRLYLRVSARVADAERANGGQMPTYRAIESERYKGGDFFFVPAGA